MSRDQLACFIKAQMKIARAQNYINREMALSSWRKIFLNAIQDIKMDESLKTAA